MTDGNQIALDPDSFEAVLNIAFNHYGEGEFKEATGLLRGLTLTNPDDPRPYRLLGSIYLLERKAPEAEEVFARAHELNPGDPYVTAALGELKLDVNRITEAVELFEGLFASDEAAAHPAAQRARALLERTLEKLKRVT